MPRAVVLLAVGVVFLAACGVAAAEQGQRTYLPLTLRDPTPTPSRGAWATKTPMSTARCCMGVAAGPNGRIYAVGGYAGRILATVEEYNPATDTWTRKADMPTARASLGLAAAPDGKLYAVGGGNETASVNTVEAYDPATDSWATRSPLPTGRAELGVAVGGDGRLYAIGGHAVQAGSFGPALATVERYDPASDSWEAVAPLPSPAYGVGVAASASTGKVYAVGGYGPVSGGSVSVGNQDVVNWYDPSSGAWSATRFSGFLPAHHGMAEAGGQLYVVGGQRLGVVRPYAWAFDPIRGAWTEAAPMAAARSQLGLAGVNGKLYAIGGYTSERAGCCNVATVEEYTPPGS
jgi:N-acetylneuraminic acid mutarotase